MWPDGVAGLPHHVDGRRRLTEGEPTVAIISIRDKTRGAEDTAKHRELEAAQAADEARRTAVALEQARREADEARREQAKEYKRRERELSGEVARLEEQVAALLALPAPKDRPGHDLRTAARTWLHSTVDAASADVFGDEVAGSLHQAGFRCTRLLAFVEQDVGVDHQLADRVDHLEVELWGAFTRRVRLLAGESS